ncbi:MAG: polyprenol monophosphomannose synthase [Promethearchaeota archaeon]
MPETKKDELIPGKKYDLAIILPTYNERKNLTLLVPVLEDIFEKNDINGHIIIVDDNSKDGTARVAIKFARVYKNIVVIQRPAKLGLGSAYRIGFKKALSMGKKIIMEMDADLSHRPSYIPKFLKCIEKYDSGLVIGSRYCSKGATKDWPLKRKVISHGANFITRMMFNIKQTKDVTSGFRAYKAETLKKIQYNDLETNGYAWQIETLYKTRKSKISIKEIPIIFYEREIGQSKLGFDEIKEFLIFLIKTQVKRVKDFFIR